jgi:predicted RNA-binding Zn-ribbon protein involved in translation (DUF1610 family)
MSDLPDPAWPDPSDLGRRIHQLEALNGRLTRLLELRCPACGSEVYRCESDHFDELGPRFHCRSASMHNYLLNGALA